MRLLALKAYLKLIHFDLYLAQGNFAALYDSVRNYPSRAYLLSRGPRMHLVLEGGSLSAAVCSRSMSPETVRRIRTNGHWCPPYAV
jgi:hypothetical protein